MVRRRSLPLLRPDYGAWSCPCKADRLGSSDARLLHQRRGVAWVVGREARGRRGKGGRHINRPLDAEREALFDARDHIMLAQELEGPIVVEQPIEAAIERAG